MNVYIRDLVRRLHEQGWRVEKGKHLKFYSPCGNHIIVSGCTESDHRALRNTLSRLKKAGFHD